MRNDWNDELDILSAENVQFTVEAAGLGSRLGAITIDLTLQGLVWLGLTATAAAASDYVLPLLGGAKQWGDSFLNALMILVPFVISLGYGFFFEWLWDGQTPGKRWLGLRVMQTSGMPITVWEAMVRNVLRLADFLPLFYGLGALVALINGQNRRIGDLVAGTIVARERHEATKSKILDIDAAADAFLAATAPNALAATAPNALAATVSAQASAAPPQSAFRFGFPAKKPPAQAAVAQAVVAQTSGAQSLQNVVMQNGTAIGEVTGAISMQPALHSAEQTVPLDARMQELLENMTQLNEADIELLHEFMARRVRLKGPARVRLAQGLAARLSAQMGRTPPLPVHVEPWLETLSHALHHARNGAASQ